MSLQYVEYLASCARRFWVNIYQCSFLAPFWINIFQKRETKYEVGSITEQFAKNLCNEHFYLVAHLAQLERMSNPPRQVRRLRTSAESLQQAFAQQGIEYYDLTGQDYHPGRLDFENIAVAEVDQSLTTPKIIICEHPAVFLRGKLIQTAKGIVARPP